MPKRPTSVNPANKRRAKKPIKRRKNSARNAKKDLFERSNVVEGEKLWIGGLTTKLNFERIGLQYNPNSRKKLFQSKGEDAPAPHWVKQEEPMTEKKVDFVKKVAEKGGVLPDDEYKCKGKLTRLTEENAAYCKALIDKHGDDTYKMFRDIKVNYLQWSEGEIKKKVKIYHLRHENE